MTNDFETERRKRREINVGEELSQESKILIHRMFQMGAIRVGNEETFALHRNFPDAPKSLVFFNSRKLRRFPEIKAIAVGILEDLIVPLKPDLLADVPKGASIFVSSLSDRTGIGQITPVMDGKVHELDNDIDGLLEEDIGKTVVGVEDAISYATSSIPVVEKLSQRGLKVIGVISIIDHLLGGSDRLKEKVPLVKSGFDVVQMLDYLRTSGEIDLNTREKALTRQFELKNYLLNVG